MADSNRLTEALKELADALPRSIPEQETHITITVPGTSFEDVVATLRAERGVRRFEIPCGHCRFTIESAREYRPIVTLR
jgi:hypothetical protein